MFGRRNPQLFSSIDWSVFRVLLLAIFILIGTFPSSICNRGPGILPRWKHGKPFPEALDEHARVAFILKDGAIYYGADRVTQNKLVELLRSDVSKDGSGTLFIKSDLRAPYGLVTEVVEAAGKAGIERVVFLGESKEGTYLDAFNQAL